MQVLKKQLDGIDELRFVFTATAFVTEKTPKEKQPRRKWALAVEAKKMKEQFGGQDGDI